MSEGTGRPSGLREEPAQGRGWLSVGLMALAAVVLLGAAYVGAAYYFKDRPPAGVKVAGVDIGTLTEQQAKEVLTRQLADRTSSPITVLVPGADGEEPAQLSLVPDEAGLTLDLDATLQGTTGLSFHPADLWGHLAGADRELPLHGAVDRQALEAAVTELGEGYAQEPVEGGVTIDADGVQTQDARPGRSLEVAATADEVEQAWLTKDWPAADEREVPGHATQVAPELPQAEIDRFVQEDVALALGEPVRVTATRGNGGDNGNGDSDDNDDRDDSDADDGRDSEASATAELVERDLRALLSVQQEDGQLSLAVDEQALLARVRQDLGQLEAGPRDATVRLDGTEVEVVPARVGYALEEDGLPEQVQAALGAQGEDRTVEVAVSVVEPAIPTAASRDWRFSTMGSFVSAFPTGPANEARTANLRAGVENVNGTVVMPGEQFSLGAALGDLTEEGGYVEAPVIIDGRLVMGLGGGLSQISTVVLNASWNSGVQLDAHTPHSFYIARYPAGREATLAYPYLDNVWTNDTDNPVVVHTWIEGEEIHMSYLGQRQYDVRTIEGPRRDVTTGEKVEDDSPECVPQTEAEGFTITVARELSRDGELVHRDEFTTTYQPSDEVTCTHPEAHHP